MTTDEIMKLAIEWIDSEVACEGSRSSIRCNCGAAATALRTAVESLVAERDRLREALFRIEKWHGEFPPTGRFFDGAEMSYSTAFGSNGERDYMRDLARAALKVKP